MCLCGLRFLCLLPHTVHWFNQFAVVLFRQKKGKIRIIGTWSVSFTVATFMLLSPFQLTRLMYWSSEQTDGCILRMVVREINRKHQAGSEELLLSPPLFTYWLTRTYLSSVFCTYAQCTRMHRTQLSPALWFYLCLFSYKVFLSMSQVAYLSSLIKRDHVVYLTFLAASIPVFFFYSPFTSEQISYSHPFWSVFFFFILPLWFSLCPPLYLPFPLPSIC